MNGYTNKGFGRQSIEQFQTGVRQIRLLHIAGTDITGSQVEGAALGQLPSFVAQGGIQVIHILGDSARTNQGLHTIGHGLHQKLTAPVWIKPIDHHSMAEQGPP